MWLNSEISFPLFDPRQYYYNLLDWTSNTSNNFIKLDHATLKHNWSALKYEVFASRIKRISHFNLIIILLMLRVIPIILGIISIIHGIVSYVPVSLVARTPPVGSWRMGSGAVKLMEPMVRLVAAARLPVCVMTVQADVKLSNSAILSSVIWLLEKQKWQTSNIL